MYLPTKLCILIFGFVRLQVFFFILQLSHEAFFFEEFQWLLLLPQWGLVARMELSTMDKQHLEMSYDILMLLLFILLWC